MHALVKKNENAERYCQNAVEDLADLNFFWEQGIIPRSSINRKKIQSLFQRGAEARSSLKGNKWG
jgi:hypothetical protein